MPNIRANLRPNTDQAVTPLAYDIREITLRNHKGEIADIQNIVTDFTITESLYTASLIFRANVKDVANFMEQYQLNGQETIRVRLGRRDYDSPITKEIDLEFYVTEYPTYGRGGQQNTQVYVISGITQHGYVSQFKKISRAVSGVITDEIVKILTKDLIVKNIGQVDNAVSNFSGVIPNMHPLDAAYWMLRRTYDSNNAPFFIHETLQNGIEIRSLTNLFSEKINPVYQTYFDQKIFTTQAGTKEDFNARATRIYDISSDFKMSKVFPALNGAFASKNHYLDLSTKQFTSDSFDYSKSFDPALALDKYSVLSSSFTIPTQFPSYESKLSSLPDSHLEYININSLAFSTDGSIKNYHNLIQNRIGTMNSLIENIDSFVHDITVAGDFGLSSGKIIILKIPKAIDPAEYDPTTQSNSDDVYDRILSGKYIITAIVHSFGSEYYCKLRVKRDALSYNLNAKT